MSQSNNKSQFTEDCSEDGIIEVRSHKIDQSKKPDLDRVDSVTLSEGPRSKKEARYTIIVDRHTGEIHHDSVSIKSYKLKNGEYIDKPEKSVTLSNEKTDEIQTLIDFILAARSQKIPDKSGKYLILEAPNNATDHQSLVRFLNDLSGAGKIDVLADVLNSISYDRSLFTSLLERASKQPKLFAEAAAALNLVTYKQAHERLKELIADNTTKERDLQKLLEENPWMFGSEYSELLPQRKLTRNEEQDFIMRRTADNYIEVIEIKTPLNGQKLFSYDSSHDCYYASAPLSKVIGQVQNYLDLIDADRYNVMARDSEDPFKTRAKIIIGQDGDAKELQALRSLNGHLNRIEVITFDQLLNTAKNVMKYLYAALRPASS